VTNIGEVKRSIADSVEKELFRGVPVDKRPRLSNRRYHPTKRDLRNHVSRAIAAQKYSKDDQESSGRKIEEWQENSPSSRFFFRPHHAKQTEEAQDKKAEEDQPQQKFLFIHQEEWQQRLSQRYGSELVFMDATYKTTKYAIPLFFVYVRTNVDYKVVAEFMTQYEDQQSISEALSILKSWNPLWQPIYFMVDFSTVEIGAIEEQFPGATAYICDFHRLQAWQRWVRKSKNGFNSLEQEELLAHLKRVTNATTRKYYDSAVASLKNLPLYKEKSNVQTYVDNVWLSCSFRWAKCTRKRQILNVVDTNNGTEAQNKTFKYEYLPLSLDKSVYGISVMLVERYVPDCHQRYLQRNLQLSSAYRRFNSTMPSYLHNRPPHFIKHCLKAKFSSGDLRECDVECVDMVKGVFSVRSSLQHNRFHEVKLSEPNCTCEQWEKFHSPCKHFFGVFNFFADEWDFESLPSHYRNSVFITLDTGHLELEVASKLDEAVSNNVDKVERGRQDPITVDEDEELHDEEVHVEHGEEDPKMDVAREKEDEKEIMLKGALKEKAKCISDLTYLVEDVSVLQTALDSLKNVVTTMDTACIKQEGLPIRQSPRKRKLKLKNVEYHKVFHSKLPLRRGLKSSKAPQSAVSFDFTEDDDFEPPVKRHKLAAVHVSTSTTMDHKIAKERPDDREHVIDVNENVDTLGPGQVTNNHLHKEDHPKDVALFDRIRQAINCRLAVTDVMRVYGPTKITVGDFWTSIPPSEQTLREEKKVQESVPDHTPGWLMSTAVVL